MAAYLADQPDDVDRLTMTLDQIQALLGDSLPDHARFPSWWRNDDRRMHSRAWLTAGWEVAQVDRGGSSIVFQRRKSA